MKTSTIFILLTYLCAGGMGFLISIMGYNPWNSWEFWAIVSILAFSVIFRGLEKDALSVENEQ